MRPKRVLIAAGGTGGHFYPGLAVAQALRDKGWQPLLILRPQAAAEKLLEEKEIAAVPIDLEALPRSVGPKLLRFGFKLLRSSIAARRIVQDFEPDVVLGMGGYVSVPCLVAARMRKIPAAVHESNAVLGLANRLCRGFGAKVFWGLPPVSGLKSGELLTGTPLRVKLCGSYARDKSRLELGLVDEPSMTTVLIFGGSQGAAALNVLIPRILTRLAQSGGQNRRALQVLHLCGKSAPEPLRQAYAEAPFKAIVLPYLEAMEQAYAAADLVICRAGASTLAELFAQKKPAILVPYPHAAAQHQRVNAGVFEAAGSALVIEEEHLETDLPGALKSTLFSPESARRRDAMSENYARLALPKPMETVPTLVRAIEALAI